MLGFNKKHIEALDRKEDIKDKVDDAIMEYSKFIPYKKDDHQTQIRELLANDPEGALNAGLRGLFEQEDCSYWDHRLVVMNKNNELIAFVMGDSDSPSNFGEVAVLFVSKNYRKKGLATKLISLVEDYYKRLNFDMIKIICIKSNKNGLKLYKSLGYQVTGQNDYGMKINGVWESYMFFTKLF